VAVPSVVLMRSRSLAAQHDAAVARRLELLTSELAAVRGHDGEQGATHGGAADTVVRRAVSWSPQTHTHIRAVPDLEDEPDGERAAGGVAPPPAVVRLPGRHAARRVASPWAGMVPETLRGRVALGPGQVAVVAVLAVVGLVLTCWWLVRSGGREVAAPSVLSSPAGALVTPAGAHPDGKASGAVAPASASRPRAKVVVDVTGKVRHPGIAVLRQGSRVIDALRAAGGARPGVDLSGLNLARVLTDGEQVVVGMPSVSGPVASAPSPGSPVTGLVNLNTADETALESLPEVGPVTAQSIITWRTQHGGFTSVNQLLDVDGIGDATLAKITPYVTI